MASEFGEADLSFWQERPIQFMNTRVIVWFEYDYSFLYSIQIMNSVSYTLLKSWLEMGID